ncbi:mitochondrial import inner membrane translocase subunit Tim29 [Periophthalmus magnuspinnatus]|uniref:mitochondrial import inner membrane translocase subunit Tim29 n=1 Tax=Periophthalmus magnuspinnatus TaxID=409849 RepID=UPI00145B25D5|nr:mitochondrial import inner membrane translocase subunit Tim29 [Periophthalmus magnuspinnatus]
MASFRAVRRALCTAAEAAPPAAPAPVPASRWERVKQSKAGVWCRSLLSDYKEACREVVVGARERPLKASVYLGLLGGAYACFSTRPDQSSFQATLLDRSNQLALLSPWIRNAASDLHVQNLVKLRNQGCLHHLSLGFVSLVYSSDFDPQSALYEAACPNLSVPWRELPERVLDVGFAGRWWVLDRKMEDFDVNEAEYKHLPAYMQTTAPPGVQEVERNEKLHKDSWLPITVHEEEETAERTGDKEAEVEDVKVDDVKVDTAHVDTVDTAAVTEAKMEDVKVDSGHVDTAYVDPVDTAVETQAEVEDMKVDTAYVDTVDTAAEIQMDTETAETLDIKVEINKEDMTEDSLVETLDTKEETQMEQTLDTSALETVEIKKEAEETRVDTHVVEMVDAVAMEMVDTPEEAVGEEDVEQTAAQSMKN